MPNHPSKNEISETRWSPNPSPAGDENLSDYLFHELNRLSDVLFNIDVMRLDKTYKDPQNIGGTDKGKPRDGDIRYSDGSDWDAGQGKNIYWYDGSQWIAMSGAGGAGDYGQFYDTSNQIAGAINTGQGVTWGGTASSRGVSVDGVDTTKINFTHSGRYYIDFTATIHSENASTKEIYFWPAKNGTDVFNSGMVHSLDTNNHRRTISRSGIFEITAGDYLQAMWATSDTDLDLHGLAASAFAPAIPSATLSVIQVSQ